ncbi:MAG: TIGR03663 family protein [Anaerolineae bacterium]|nr:TIGR03663 family protein [Anaerolineae bacterium]
MTVQNQTLKNNKGLDTPILATFTLNWEIVLYVGFFLIAIFTHFYLLGARVMSHDESLHTLYSWNLYAGKGYRHDPLMHGPFLFHITALMYFLFGDNDFTARLAPAIFGIVLVILPYWFRPWLGRVGALAASFMMLVSPGLLYYGRYIRNEAFVVVWTTLMVLAFFQYMRTRANRWLFIGAAAVSLMVATKEVAYIHGFIGFTFIAWALLWENLSPVSRRWTTIGMLAVILTLVMTMLVLAGQPDFQAPSGEEAGFGLNDVTGLLLMVATLVIGAVMIQLGVDRERRPVTAALKNLYKGDPLSNQVGFWETVTELIRGYATVIQAVAVAAIIFALLYTTFLSNIGGLATGTYGAISYWLSQQEVERGSQPWYYYLFLVPMYEFLPVLVGLIGGLVYLIRPKPLPAHADMEPVEMNNTAPARPIYPSDGGTFAGFIIYWTLLAVVIYSWAGEKMPWLTVHITLPFVFLAAHVIQTGLGKFNRADVWRKGGLILGGALLLTIPVFIALFTAEPFKGQSLQDIQETFQFILALLVLLGLGWVVWYYGQRVGLGNAWRTAFITLLLVLTLLTIRFAWMFNYINYDYVNEMMVYAHASPDVKLALNQIDDISRRTVGDKKIKVAYDNDSTWPLEWYMREYPNRAYYGENPTREALDSPIVIVGSANESKVKPFLGDKYARFRYRLVWWPIEDYKNQSLERLWQTYVVGPPPADPAADTAEAQALRRQAVRDNWRKLWKIWFYRDYEDYELNEWPYVHRFYLYVRKDVLQEIWDYQSGPVELVQLPSLDPYEGKRAEADALQIWGSNGNGDGQFVTPRNVAVAPDGRIYVADSGNHRIQVFDSNGNFLFKWGSQGNGPGQLNEPWGLAVAADGTVFVADTWNHRIQKFSANGEPLGSFGAFANVQSDPQAEPGTFWGPRDIAIDATGNLYVTDTGNKRIQKFTPAGQFMQAWGGGGIVPGTFEEPVGIDIDSQGNFYVADTWNRRIQKFDPDFNPLTQWEVVGWESEGVVNKPYLAIDDQDRVFITDPEGYRVIAYDNSGQVIVTWGQYGQDRASFALPVGLDFDPQGNLLVADSDNNRVMKFTVPVPSPPQQ